MQRAAATLLLIVLTAPVLWSQNVAEEEITGVEPGSVEFLNYEGPHEEVQSAGEIRGIGSVLALPERQAGAESTYFDKYRFLHVIGEGEPEKFHADLFIITDRAVVDHVDNIRRIIAGYLEETYGYEQEKADTLATFLTYYNAVYRQDMEYFRQRYKTAVIEELDPEKAGLATVYSEWPGNTQLLIPLRDTAEGAEPSADEAGGEEVVDKVREEEEDRGVESRRDMVEVREEQLEEDEQELEERQEEARQEEEEIEQTEEEIAEQEEEIEEQRQEGAPEEEVAAAEEELEQQREETEQQREELEQEQQEIAQAEEEQEQRRDDIQEEREQIAEDQQEMIEEEQAQAEEQERKAPLRTIPFVLFRRSGGDLLGTVVKADTATGEVVGRSQINVIRSREMVLRDEQLVVIAGMDDPPRAVRLIAVNAESLEKAGESDADVHPDSALRQRNGDIFAVVRRDDQWRLGRFTGKLALRTTSERAVAPYTAMNFDGDTVYVQSTEGKVLQFDLQTLRTPEEGSE